MNYALDKRIDILLNKIFKNRKSNDTINVIHKIILDFSFIPLGNLKNTLITINNILFDNNLKDNNISKIINKNHDYVSINLADIISKNIKKSNNEIKIVDIGGGEGTIIKNIGNILEIPSNNLYCVEPNNEWVESYRFNNNINYIFWDNVHINIPDNSTDVVILMVSLHHMTDQVIDNTIKNIKRILKSDGIVIIKEHDMTNEDIKYTIDWEHHLYHILNSKNEDLTKNRLKKYIKKFINNYKSKDDFDNLFMSYNLKGVEELNRQFKPLSCIDYTNASNLYWKIYQNIV